jgi:hypothetical protein
MFICNPDGTLPFDFDKEKIHWDFDKNSTKEWFSSEYPGLYRQFKNSLFPQGVQGTMTQFLIKQDTP